ncbi:MAG: M48 family metallopeptidase [Verrucomicrobia bacterium]|nr:M48 family metallopeptidase [Verrucomicrobiota bacterium]
MRFLVLSLVALGLVACQNAPVTGRSQFIMVNESEVASMSSGEFSKMKKLPNDARLAKIKEIGLKIVASARRDDRSGVLPPAAKWEFAIIDDKSPNAFAMPGGRIGFNSGMFQYAPTDDDVAVILGHEVSHVICRHGAERISQGLGVAMVAAITDEATKNKSSQTRATWMAAVGVGAQVGILLPFSRSHESEADHLGLMFMARAGYNPEAAPAFWARFAKIGGSRPPEFLSTHPADATRIKQLQAWLPEAKAQMPSKP